MLGSLKLTFQIEKTRYWVLAVQKEKTRCWKAGYWQFRKKKPDAGKLGIGTSESKNQMPGSLPLTDQKEKTRFWEAWFWQFRNRKNLMLGSLVLALQKGKPDAGKLAIDRSERKH
jgi:hypothetical protein